jgi:hypothetical protein
MVWLAEVWKLPATHRLLGLSKVGEVPDRVPLTNNSSECAEPKTHESTSNANAHDHLQVFMHF